MKRIIFYSALLSSITVAKGYQNTTINITSCGGSMNSAHYTSIGSFSPVCGATTLSTRYCNHSGFAAGFILQPSTAFSGLADEWNPDNDLDRLMDTDEIMEGSSLYNSDTDVDGLLDVDEVKTYGTNPVLADSDSDGMNDNDELLAGTSATNATSLLAIRCELLPGGDRILSWYGVSGRLYTVEFTSTLNTNSWETFSSGLLGFDQIISLLDESSLDARFYRVKVRKED